MTSDEIYEVLVSLGYVLQDRGAYWQTNALFRQGDNKTALQIYKDTGVWRDFVNNTPPLRFETLVEKSLGEDNPDLKRLIKDKNFDSLLSSQSAPQQKLQMEDVYPDDSLKKLLPHYRFYNDRGICDETLKVFKGGLATQGQLYQRFVFPIYNEFGQIHGFSGRDMLNKNNRPKWKHIGKKSKWVYPAYVPTSDKSFLSILEEMREIILVESVGDLLSLHHHGYYNVLVTFGLDVSPALISTMVQLNPQKIILSFNNDIESQENRGLVGSLKSYLKLLSYFDYEKLYICLPTHNDFGDMKSDSFEKWDEKLHNINPHSHCLSVLEQSQLLVNKKQLSQKLIKNRNLLAEIFHE